MTIRTEKENAMDTATGTALSPAEAVTRIATLAGDLAAAQEAFGRRCVEHGGTSEEADRAWAATCKARVQLARELGDIFNRPGSDAFEVLGDVNREGGDG